MADITIAPFGGQTVAVAASAVVATYSSQQYTVQQMVGYPNEPNTLQTLFSGVGYFTSSAFTAAGTAFVSAGSAPVSVQTGASAVVGVVQSFPAQGNPGALNATGTLTAALLYTRIVTSTSAAAVTATLDTGSVMEASASMAVGDSFEWSVINTGPNTFTVTASTGHTVVGAGAVATATSGRFRTRKTAVNTFVTYCIA